LVLIYRDLSWCVLSKVASLFQDSDLFIRMGSVHPVESERDGRTDRKFAEPLRGHHTVRYPPPACHTVGVSQKQILRVDKLWRMLRCQYKSNEKLSQGFLRICPHLTSSASPRTLRQTTPKHVFITTLLCVRWRIALHCNYWIRRIQSPETSRRPVLCAP